MSVILHSSGPQANFKKGPHWYHESPFLPYCWEDRQEPGAPSLKHTARQKALEDQSELRLEMFENIPWPIALELWEYLGHCKKRTLFMWKIMAASYPREFHTVSSYYCLWTNRPMEPLKGYVDIMSSANCDWRAVLSLSSGYATAEDLLAIGNMKNLVALEISRTPWKLHKYAPEITPRVANELENGVIRTWVDLAESTGSLQHLRVLRLYHQGMIKPAALQLLGKLPNLQLIIVYQCEYFTQGFRCERRPYSGKIEMEGWNALRLDWALKDATEDGQALQHLGPLLDVYRGALKTQPNSSSVEDPPSPHTLGADVPIMEFGLPAMDHSDTMKIEVRAQYSAKSIGILTRVPNSTRKRQLPLPAESKKNGKRVMKDRGARDMTDLLKDFL
ncbi:unnamed protein product [Penicillium pancosmium]